MHYLKTSEETSVFFPFTRKKNTAKDAEAEGLKKQILTQHTNADKLIKEVRRDLSDPTLQIFYATRKRGKN